MNTISVAWAAVTGARHLRVARNGQDAAAAWAGAGMGAVVVCDGCSAGAGSEVGARLGAQLVIAQLAARLSDGERPRALWSGVRAQVVAALGRLARAMPGDPAAVIREHFLFTIVAAAVAGDEACVWAIGDGAYAFRVERTPGGAPDMPDVRDRSAEVARDPLHVLGPFADNQPPYLAYDLLGMPTAAHLDVRDARAGQIVVATDGAAELDGAGLFDGLLEPRTLAHPDGL
ncbi:MAG TPA: protein phosphatase 2C domain-containing protein, partial [Kofleriaceae bacterium]